MIYDGARLRWNINRTWVRSLLKQILSIRRLLILCKWLSERSIKALIQSLFINALEFLVACLRLIENGTRKILSSSRPAQVRATRLREYSH